MSTEDKKALLAQLVYAEEIALGNIPADLHTMTETEVHMYFDGYMSMLAVCQVIAESEN